MFILNYVVKCQKCGAILVEEERVNCEVRSPFGIGAAPTESVFTRASTTLKLKPCEATLVLAVPPFCPECRKQVRI